MAKKNEKLVALETKVTELTQAALDASVNAKKAEMEALENGKLMVGMCLFLRDAFVKSLNEELVKASPFGGVVIDVLKRLDEKSPGTKCPKCDGTGVVSIRDDWRICFGCVCGRILGKPGVMHVVDRKVHSVHEAQLNAERQNRFNRYAPSAAEVEAAIKAKAEKAKAASSSDDFGL